jgi:energy-converting hydrogenase Eha subunit E
VDAACPGCAGTSLAVAFVQGVYFFVTGVWPILHIPSFEAVTGPKTDDWLVKTVGVLVAVVGLALVWGACRGCLAPEGVVLAVGSSAALGAVDVSYALRGVISRIYLADAVAQAGLLVAWWMLC